MAAAHERGYQKTADSRRDVRNNEAGFGLAGQSGSCRINLERQGDRLTITSNHGPAQGETSMPAFLAGTKAFLRRFAKEASVKVSGVLEWKDLEVLRLYV